MKKYIIDRFEENYAVCEDENGDFADLPRNKMPADSREGSCIVENDGVFSIDSVETLSREQKMKNLFDSLRKK